MSKRWENFIMLKIELLRQRYALHRVYEINYWKAYKNYFNNLTKYLKKVFFSPRLNTTKMYSSGLTQNKIGFFFNELQKKKSLSQKKMNWVTFHLTHTKMIDLHLFFSLLLSNTFRIGIFLLSLAFEVYRRDNN